MYQDIERVLLSREEIAGKVAEIGKALSEEYRGKTPLVVCLLKGSAIFFADLVRAMDCKLEMDFMAVSSYGGANSTGEVRVLKDLDKSIEGRDVIIVEDIVDTGLTLNYLMKMLKGAEQGPSRSSLCSISLPAVKSRSMPTMWAFRLKIIMWWATAWTTTSNTATCLKSASSVRSFMRRTLRAVPHPVGQNSVKS